MWAFEGVGNVHPMRGITQECGQAQVVGHPGPAEAELLGFGGRGFTAQPCPRAQEPHIGSRVYF